MLNTTKPTKEYMEKLGYTVVDVEAKGRGYIKQDVLGFIDLIAMREHTIGVQATSISNMASRRKKILSSPHIRHWLGAGNQVWLFGWEEKFGKLMHSLQKISLQDVALFQAHKDGN